MLTALHCRSTWLQVGLWREAQDTLQGMQAEGVQPNTIAYNALIKALGSGGQWQQVSRSLTYTLASCAESRVSNMP